MTSEMTCNHRKLFEKTYTNEVLKNEIGNLKIFIKRNIDKISEIYDRVVEIENKLDNNGIY